MAYDEASFQAGFATGRFLWDTEFVPRFNPPENQNRQVISVSEDEENES